MNEDELQAIYDISKDKTPVIFVGVWLGLDKQERANRIWVELGKKYGFKWETVERSPMNDDHYFLAIPAKIMPEYDFKGLMLVEKESKNGCNGCFFKEKYTDWGMMCWDPRVEAKIPSCSKGKNGRLSDVIFVKK
jgi:hypothetical protein